MKKQKLKLKPKKVKVLLNSDAILFKRDEKTIPEFRDSTCDLGHKITVKPGGSIVCACGRDKLKALLAVSELGSEATCGCVKLISTLRQSKTFSKTEETIIEITKKEKLIDMVVVTRHCETVIVLRLLKKYVNKKGLTTRAAQTKAFKMIEAKVNEAFVAKRREGLRRFARLYDGLSKSLTADSEINELLRSISSAPFDKRDRYMDKTQYDLIDKLYELKGRLDKSSFTNLVVKVKQRLLDKINSCE